MQRTPPPALAPAAHTKRANLSSGSADFSRAPAHALSPTDEPTWALNICSLSAHGGCRSGSVAFLEAGRVRTEFGMVEKMVQEFESRISEMKKQDTLDQVAS